MNKLLHNFLITLLLSAMLIPITGQAYKKTYDVKVGETFTVYTTFYSNTTAILWTIPYTHVQPVGYVGPTATCVTFKAVKAISSGAIIQAVTYANYSRAGVDDWLVIISDEDGGNEGGGDDVSISLPSLSASPSGGMVERGTKVKLYANGKGAEWSYDQIYYTLDDSDPKYGNHIDYTFQGIVINENCTLRAIAKKWTGDKWMYSNELKETYNVDPILVTSFRLNRNSAILTNGESMYLFGCDFEPTNSTNHQVTWSTSNPEVATIRIDYYSCVVTGVGAGTATITCNTTDGSGASATCEITVIDGVFTEQTVEGIDVRYRIVSEENKTCEVGTGLESKKALLKTMTSETTITIPKIVNGYRVIGISSYAFDSRFSGSTKVVLPEGISYIGGSAFNYCSLTEINLPNSLVSIGSVAFGNCKIKDVKIPNKVESIGRFAFGYCKEMTSAEIPGSVKSLEEYSFAYCDNLTSVILHEGITGIGRDAFNGCPLIDVTVYSKKPIRSVNFPKITVQRLFVPKGVKEYYGNKDDLSKFVNADISDIFEMDDVVVNLFSAKNEDGYEMVYDVLNESQKTCEVYDIPFSYKEVLTIPDKVNGYNVNRIGYRARNYRSYLKKVIIPNSIRSIGDYAFEFSDNLSNIVTMVDEPFEMADNVFNTEVYETATLYVPIGTKSKYESTIGWKYFRNIVELGTSGIENVSYTEETTNIVYDLFGRRLDKPRKGINIIGGKKVIVKCQSM